MPKNDQIFVRVILTILIYKKINLHQLNIEFTPKQKQ
jgi:hypothetical protein